MPINSVISLREVSKKYNLYHTPIDRLKEAFSPFKKQYHRDFFALRDLSFNVGQGEILGIVGKNGSGKSTLLQIITGILTPSTGSVEVNGKISALLELGAGFNPELTGIENVYFKSSLLGNSSEETGEKFNEILEFADIGEFIDQPVKTYSSGMFVRLAFAVAINVDPDVLIVDEALSVGDFRFRQKCLRKIKKFREDGKTILFVSHDTGAVTEFCTRAIWLRDGKSYMDGSPAEVCKEYISFMSFGEISNQQDEKKKLQFRSSVPAESVDSYIPWIDISGCSSFGKGGAVIKRIAFYRKEGFERIDSFEGGIRVILALEILVKKDIVKPIVGFLLGDTKGIHVLGMNTKALGKDLGQFSKGEVRVVEFEFDFPFLKTGEYAISPAIAENDLIEGIVQNHWVYDAHIVQIASNYEGARLGHYLVIKNNFEVRVE